MSTDTNVISSETSIAEPIPEISKPSAFDSLKDEDKKFVKVQEGMTIIHAINMLEGHINIMTRKLQACFPRTPYETVKIIMSRLNDIKNDEVQNLSLGFIKTELFTVDGKEEYFKLPENLDDENIRKNDELNYLRAGVMMLKLNDEQIAAHMTYITKLKEKFDNNVTDDVKVIIASVDSLNDFTEEYYNWKLNDPDTDETVKNNIRKTLEYMEYAVNLKPIRDDLEELYKRKGNLSSVMYNFRNQSSKIADSAAKACKVMNITFPNQILTEIESKFFGPDKYKDYKYLLSFLIARHVRYYGNRATLYDKIFLTQLFSNLVYISRSSTDPSKDMGVSKLKAKMKPHVESLLNFVIKHI